MAPGRERDVQDEGGHAFMYGMRFSSGWIHVCDPRPYLPSKVDKINSSPLGQPVAMFGELT
jgi:hypothetical protein